MQVWFNNKLCSKNKFYQLKLIPDIQLVHKIQPSIEYVHTVIIENFVAVLFSLISDTSKYLKIY